MGPTGRPTTSVNSYLSALRNIAEECKAQVTCRYFSYISVRDLHRIPSVSYNGYAKTIYTTTITHLKTATHQNISRKIQGVSFNLGLRTAAVTRSAGRRRLSWPFVRTDAFMHRQCIHSPMVREHTELMINIKYSFLREQGKAGWKWDDSC
jgi:hypothetical protein